MKARLIKRFEDEILSSTRATQELPKEIQRARELGDLRENAEYAAAKERQRFVETRVSMLRTRVSEIQLMNMEKIPHDRAASDRSSPSARTAASSSTSWSCRRTPTLTRARLGRLADRARIRRQRGRRRGTVPTPAGVRSFEILGLVTIHDEE